MPDVFAVKPPRGRIVHLHVPGYRPGIKERPLKDRQAMCAAPIWPNGYPAMEHSRVPLPEALRWASLEPSPSDPRPSWVWCGKCIGHLVTLAGMEREVLGAALAKVGGES